MKPQLKDVLEIREMKEEAKALYDEIDRRMIELCEEFGSGRFDYDLGEVDEDGKRYLKFEVIDNILKMRNGESIWKSTSIKPVSFSVAMLKGCPKALK